MNKFDRWIRKITDQQKVSYRDEHWDSFAGYMAQKNKPNLWKLTGLLLLLLVTLGTGIALLLGFYPLSGNATDSIATSSFQTETIGINALDHPEHSPSTGHIMGGSTLRENIPLSSNNSINVPDNGYNQPIDISGDITMVNLPFEQSPGGAVKLSSERPQQKVTSIEDSPRQFTEEEFENEVYENKDLFKYPGEKTSSLKGESLAGLNLIKSLLKPLQNPDPIPNFSVYNQFPLRNSPENKTTQYFSILASGIFNPGSAGDGHFILGGSIGGEFTVEFNRKWSISSGLGLMWRRGTFGVQMDHPHLIYDFEKTTSGYQLLPQSTAYAQAHFHLGKIWGPWTAYGGVTLNYLLGVRGELWSYEYNRESSPSTVASEKQSEGWIGKEGIKNVPLSLDIGLSCRVANRWTVGLSSAFYPAGLIDGNHASEYDFNSDTYSENEKDRWKLVENKFHLSITLKYHLH